MIKRVFQLVLAAMLLTSLLVTSALGVSADASAATSKVACDRFSASGSSDAPYVTIYAFNEVTGLFYFNIVPVSGGTYSTAVSYPAAAAGTVFITEVWGTLAPYTVFTDPNYWDHGAFYRADVACVPTAGVCTNPLPTDSVVYDVPLGAPAFYAADLKTQLSFNLPVGTWKISEYSGDFAKVWIACEATPIWIPKNSIGAAVG